MATHLSPQRYLGNVKLIEKARTFGLIAFAVIALSASVFASLWHRGPITQTTDNSSHAVSQNSSDRSVTVLALQLRDGGFVPPELTLTPGNYEFVINNISTEREATVQLSRAQGAKLESLPMKRGRTLRKLVRLTPGEYVLSVESQPEWMTRITVTKP